MKTYLELINFGSIITLFYCNLKQGNQAILSPPQYLKTYSVTMKLFVSKKYQEYVGRTLVPEILKKYKPEGSPETIFIELNRTMWKFVGKLGVTK